ncbi:ABC transporter ATP-binding protein [Olivibacter sitiensis]|uniref:ABC transporter ATP-binding protein n=1 Tax=Olivibacter sitiensis TaxID=376470 RepID=UPI000412B693|nr:ATP-binding cassette domain-containing protein [Olivibacter sitiensis]
MIIEVQHLKKIYGSRTVVDIEHLGIEAGETIGLVGNNGAGKTTFFRMLLNLIRPDFGLVLSKGMDVSKSDDWKQYTASYLDEGFLIDYLTPEEYFFFIGGLSGYTKAETLHKLEAFKDFFNGEILKSGKYIRDFSKGNQNKVGIAAALLQQPEILVLDEPFANLDPTTQIRLKNLLKEWSSKGLTSLISSHDLNHVTEVCQRIILLEKGQVIRSIETNEGTLEELKGYFGED